MTAACTRALVRLRTAAVAVPVALLVAGLVGTTGAAANPPGPHDPIGKVESVSATSPTGVQFAGWAADPDALSRNIRVAGLVDGRWVVGMSTNRPRPTIARLHGTGPTPGFQLAVHVPRDGHTHTVCAVAGNIAGGLDTVLRCVPTPLGTVLSATQLAAHSPRGGLVHLYPAAGALHVSGWATDPDDLHRRAVVVVYVDGASAATVTTHPLTGAVLPAGAGPNPYFAVNVPVATGSHLTCVWVVNVGLGSNSLLGCRSRDTRGPAGTGKVSVPAVNTKIVAEAARHIGAPYVWGAAGPKSFDCSGLVVYAYGKYGVHTPRIAADQFSAARLIPASRAVPGDLVFSYDGTGYVYHVGIYTGPGATIAAIDPAEGVNRQTIWTTTVTYGSFTHT